MAAQVPGRRPEALEEATDVSVFRKAALQVRVLDTEAETAARLANAYPEALERFLVQRRATRREASIAALDTQRSRALERAQAARTALGGFLQQQRSPSLQREQDGLLARWQQAQAELAAAELRSASLTQRLAATAQQVQAESLLAAGGLQSPVPALQRLAQELAALEVDLAAARAEYDGEQGALHPKVKALSARVQQRRQQLADESAAQAGGGAASAPLPADQLREQLRRELLELQRQRQSLGAEIQGRRAEAERLRRQLGDGQAPRLQEQQLQLQLDNALREADLLGQRLVDLNTQALRTDRQVLVLTEAVPAGAARFPNAVWNGLLGAGLGAAAALALALPLATRFARALDALVLGEASARSLGLDPPRVRLLLVVLMALATGTAVAQTGLVAFVGLVSPHLVRRLVVVTHGALLALSSLAGGLLLLAADVAARTLMAP